MVAGLRMALEMAEQPALRAVIDQPFRVPDGDSDEDLLAFARREGMTVFHPTSSCPMGSVVDAELKVYGFEGLRVADASVMPEITRANTNAATIMIAEKAADLIRVRAARRRRPRGWCDAGARRRSGGAGAVAVRAGRARAASGPGPRSTSTPCWRGCPTATAPA